jgi:flagella basal body P-ring formation protein FlgA
VGVTPRVGYSQTVSRAQVETLVGRDAGSAPVTYGGATQVKVRGRGQRLAQDTLTDTAAQALYAALAGKYTTMELQPVGESDGVSVPSGNYRLAARVPAPQTPSRRMSVLVDVLVDGRIYATVPVWFGVHASRPGFVARVPVAAGETLKAEQFRVQNVPVTEQNSESLPSDTRFGALRTRRSLEPGAVLTMAHVESRPAVSRSEKVALRVVSGAVTIETSGVALSDARMGEMIKVKPAYGSEIVTARVVGDGLVAVGAK